MTRAAPLISSCGFLMNPVKKIQLPVWPWSGILTPSAPAEEMLCQVPARTFKTFYNRLCDVTRLYENSRTVIFIFYRKSDGWALLALNHSQSPPSPQPSNTAWNKTKLFLSEVVNIQIEWLVARQKLILDHFNTRDYTEPVHCSAVQCRVVGSDILLFPYFLSKLLIKLLQTVILAVKVTALSPPTTGS